MTARMVPVTVHLPEKAFWKLAQHAEKYDMKVNELLADMALVSLRRMPQGDVDPVILRWRKGWSDKQIARDLGMTNLAVSTRRRSYGYPANSSRANPQIVRRLKLAGVA